MPDHKKPTPEEIAADLERTIQVLDEKHEDTENNQNEDEFKEASSDEVKEDVKDESSNENDEVEEVTPEEKKEIDDSLAEKETPEEDITKKYRESSAEAKELAAEEKRMSEAFLEANNLPLPNEDELKLEYPEWDIMSDTEKRLAKDNLINKKRFEVLNKASEERRVVDQWNTKVDEYLENPKTFIHNPELEGKEEAFKTYAKDKTRRNSNFGLVVSAFLHDYEKTKVHHKGQMFETGSGGDKEVAKPKSDKISVEESAKLQQTDYNKWRRLLQEGKLANQ